MDEKEIKPEFDIALEGYEYLGRGPDASNADKDGWSRDSNIAYRCVKCGDLMSADHDDYYNCQCGAVHLDIDYGRFGSNHGDQNILVYKKGINR